MSSKERTDYIFLSNFLKPLSHGLGVILLKLRELYLTEKCSEPQMINTEFRSETSEPASFPNEGVVCRNRGFFGVYNR